MPTRERIAELYNAIDAIPQSDPGDVLNIAVHSFEVSHPGEEENIRRELWDAAVSYLSKRLASQNWAQLQPLWHRLVDLWQKGGKQAAFAQPVLGIALSAALNSDPFMAAELGIAVAKPAAGVDLGAHEAMLQHFLTRLCALSPCPSTGTAGRITNIIKRWREARPVCPLITQLADRLASGGFQQGA